MEQYGCAMLEVEFAELSDPGVIRDHNEDYFGSVFPQTPEEVRAQGWLFALADGVGGSQHGEVASSAAVEKVLAGFRRMASGATLSSVLPRLIQAANTQVFETGMATGISGSSMATTIVACALRFDRVTVSHVGDSRCYLVRDKVAVALTRDHTISNEQLRLGLLTAAEAASAETSHVLSRSIGTNMFVTVDTSEHQLLAGDILVLCSDGLHHSVLPEDIVQIASAESELSAAARKLVLLAKQRDGSDNISIQIIRIRSVERVGMYRGRHYKIR